MGEDLEQNAAQRKHVCFLENTNILSVGFEVDDSSVVVLGKNLRGEIAMLVNFRVEESEEIKILIEVEMRTNDAEVSEIDEIIAGEEDVGGIEGDVG